MIKPKPSLKDRVKRTQQFISEHRYEIVFGTGMVFGMSVVHEYYKGVLEDINDMDMHVRLSPSQMEALVNGSASALVSAAEEGGGTLYITLAQ